MKKIFFCCLMLLMGVVSLNAQTLDKAIARELAATFIQQQYHTTFTAQTELVYEECGTADVTPEVYLIQVKQSANSHFVIVAAEAGIANPILGYGDNFNGNFEEAPENFKWWISQYAEEIEAAKTQGILTATNSPSTLRKGIRTLAMPSIVVPPLLGDTRWRQQEPFNNFCPTDSKGRSVVGCVATAMSQIMYYYKWPDVGQGKHTDASCTTETVDFSKSVYDWGNMLPKYGSSTTSKQDSAVAKLCYDCGVAVDMTYSSQGSGTYSKYVPNAFKTYFKYQQCTGTYKSGTTESWENRLKNELMAGRPVFYAGNDASGQGGHAFVCDGYNAKNYFHFNWGWNGFCHGYYKIGALNTSQGNFNSGNYIVYGVQPNRTATVVNGITYQLLNNNTAEVVKCADGFYAGDIIVPESIEVSSKQYAVTTIAPYAFCNCPELTSVTLPNSITTLSSSAFANCELLDSIVVPWATPLSIQPAAFNADIYSNTTLVVPNARLNTYSQKAPWYQFCHMKTAATETKEAWTAWEPFLNGFGTWTYYNHPMYSAGETAENLAILHRTSTTNENTQQFWIQGWAWDADLLINYNASTGNCTVPKAYSGYEDDENGTIYGADMHTYSSSYSYTNYPCTFDVGTGTFSLNIVYFVSRGMYPRQGAETFKVDGSPDYSFEVTVGSVERQSIDGSGKVAVNVTKGDDLDHYKYALVPRELNANEIDSLYKFICEGKAELPISSSKFSVLSSQSESLTLTLPTERVYVLALCAFDAEGKCWNKKSSTIKYYTETGWTSLGKCYYTDDVITTTFSAKLAPAGPYKVEIFQNDLHPGLLRLKHPYGTTFPYAKNGKYTTETIYIDIHAEDREGVYIDYQSTGKDLQKKGAYAFMYSKAAQSIDAGQSLEDAKTAGICGTFDGRQVTFPVGAVLCDKYATSEYTDANMHGKFLIDLSELPVGILDLQPSTLSPQPSPFYNLAGQRVGSEYKGIVIQNGRKLLKR